MLPFQFQGDKMIFYDIIECDTMDDPTTLLEEGYEICISDARKEGEWKDPQPAKTLWMKLKPHHFKFVPSRNLNESQLAKWTITFPIKYRYEPRNSSLIPTAFFHSTRRIDYSNGTIRFRKLKNPLIYIKQHIPSLFFTILGIFIGKSMDMIVNIWSK